MRTIVCFGDSNTWGADPAAPRRFAPDVRWTGVLARELGEGCRVIEEGLNGRTTNLDDTIEVHRNGRTYLLPCLESHAPFDLITIMLGTNDLKARFGRSASDIAQSATALAGIARLSASGPDGSRPRVLLMAPPPVARLSLLGEMFAGSEEKSHRFAHFYREYAAWHDVDFLDAGAVIRSSDVDGIHFDPEEHGKLGIAVAARVREILG
jgi:lysophospholipase L1-like esterase